METNGVFCAEEKIKIKKLKKNKENPGIKGHLLFCNHLPDFEDLILLPTNKNNVKLTFLHFLINKDYLPLNKNKKSLPLKLFDN